MLCSCGRAQRVHPHDGDEELSELPIGADAICTSIASSNGLLSDSLRLRAWPLLLGLGKSFESAEATKTRAAEFAALGGEETVDATHARTIDQDVPRTRVSEGATPIRALLLKHCALEPAWGYYQGMSDVAAIVASVAAADDAWTDADAFALMRGALSASSENWAHADLAGVWRQARAVRDVVAAADAKLAAKLASLETHDAAARPYAFLFGPIFLRLKRELRDFEQAKRCWEVCWANGPTFHLLVLAALVLSQRAAVLRKGAGVGEVHSAFSKLHESLEAAPLLRAARTLRDRPAVRAALAKALSAEGVASSGR